jgi:hypothetical protein
MREVTKRSKRAFMPMESIPQNMANKEDAMRQTKESTKRPPIHIYKIRVLLFWGIKKRDFIYG